ncbi:MAG: aminodeoxychorismate synthase component I [Candidatus Lightella neohaematopini]|nr:aminodeoxychorismate synthase component I [Candidatus Lightella neohaematopini]
MSLNLITLPYKDNFSLSLLLKLYNKSWTMLLHSGRSNNQNCRYDIFVTDPVIKLVTYGKVTKIQHKNNILFSNENPFLLVNNYLNKLKIKTSFNSEIPFQGGAVGIFGYDLIRNIECIPTIAKNDIYIPDMIVGIYNWAIITDHKKKINTLVGYNNLSKILSNIKMLINNNNIKINNNFSVKSWKSNMTLSEYKNKFNYIKQCLYSGECYQVCLAQRFSTTYYGNEVIAFNKLLNYNQTPFSAFIRFDNCSIISLSPERFIKVSNKNITSSPIKGTIRKLDNINDNNLQITKLLNSTKDKAENIMIVDLIRSDISKLSVPGSVYVSSLLKLETYKSIHHIVSTINAKLMQQYSNLELLNSCFPGGSITGTPKSKAINIIEQLEPNRRNLWCGSIGYISYCGNMDTNISIRTLIMNSNKIYCSVGSGIVLDSDMKSEFDEMLAKVDSIIPILSKNNYY